MWTIMILLVMISISGITIRAEISGLQNNINNGYSYNRPEAVPAELAYYQKIPPGGTFTANNIRHIDHHQQQHFHGGNAHNFGQHHHSHYNQHSIHDLVSQSISENHGDSVNSHHQHHHHQFSEPTTANQYIPPESVPNLPFIQENSGFRPINPPREYQDLPFIRENTGLKLVNSPPHLFSPHHQQHQNTFTGASQQNFQTSDMRNHQNEIPQNTLNFLQSHQNQNSPVPSEKLTPPPSFNTQSASSDSPSAIHRQPNNKFMASVIGSVNVPLPFPIGSVPIKFEPFPLKTHLRQERLLPITSYEAKEFYKK